MKEKENKKSPFNAKVLTVLLIVLFGGSCICFLIAVFTGSIGNEIIDNTVPDDTTVAVSGNVTTAAAESIAASTAAETEATEASEDRAVASAAVIVGESYRAKNAVDADGNAVDMRTCFGSGFATYGGWLTFDGQSFSVNMGVTAGSDSSTGTYDIISLNEMELKYDNSDVVVATFTCDGDSVSSISVPMDDITVTFVAE